MTVDEIRKEVASIVPRLQELMEQADAICEAGDGEASKEACRVASGIDNALEWLDFDKDPDDEDEEEEEEGEATD